MLNYPIFPRREYSSFGQVVLRSSSQDSEYAYIRDTLGAALNLDYGALCAVQDFRYFILYINGKYYGIYNFREKVNDRFVSNLYNVERKGSTVVRNNGRVGAGSRKGMNNIKSYISSHDMTKKAAFDYVAERLNIESFADYWVGAVYTTNNDMVNYRFIGNTKYDDGRLQTVFYDLDWAFYNYDRNFFVTDMTAGRFYDGTDTIISRGLMRNSTFRKIFLQRLSYGLHNQWKKSNVLAELDRQYKLLKPEMKREKQRWGGSVAQWESSIKELRRYVNKRQSYLLRQIKSVFHLSNAQMKEYFGDL